MYGGKRIKGNERCSKHYQGYRFDVIIKSVIPEEGSLVLTQGERFEILDGPNSTLNSVTDKVNKLFSLSQTHADTWKISQIIAWHLNYAVSCFIFGSAI